MKQLILVAVLAIITVAIPVIVFAAGEENQSAPSATIAGDYPGFVGDNTTPWPAGVVNPPAASTATATTAPVSGGAATQHQSQTLVVNNPTVTKTVVVYKKSGGHWVRSQRTQPEWPNSAAQANVKVDIYNPISSPAPVTESASEKRPEPEPFWNTGWFWALATLFALACLLAYFGRRGRNNTTVVAATTSQPPQNTAGQDRAADVADMRGASGIPSLTSEDDYEIEGWRVGTRTGERYRGRHGKPLNSRNRDCDEGSGPLVVNNIYASGNAGSMSAAEMRLRHALAGTNGDATGQLAAEAEAQQRAAADKAAKDKAAKDKAAKEAVDKAATDKAAADKKAADDAAVKKAAAEKLAAGKKAAGGGKTS